MGFVQVAEPVFPFLTSIPFYVIYLNKKNRAAGRPKIMAKPAERQGRKALVSKQAQSLQDGLAAQCADFVLFWVQGGRIVCMAEQEVAL